MEDHVALVRRSLAPGTAAEFDRRVRSQADRLAAAIDRGVFDNEAATLGLELEAYALTDAERPRLAPIPDDVFEGPAEKELGLHNVELNADPTRFDAAGVEAQERAIAADLADARERASEHGLEIALDAMWAVPPAEGTRRYLDDVTVHEAAEASGATAEPDDPDVWTDGPVHVAANMRRDPRYGALDNEALRRAGGELSFSVPGAELSVRSILFESLTTSIQPHVQVPDAAAFPRYHNLAVRTLGPLLALSTNSPFLPGDCYDVDDPAALVDRTPHELRIAAFEQSMNQDCRKVRVPEDVADPTDVVDHVVEDDTYAPFLEEWLGDGGEEPVASQRPGGESRSATENAPIRAGEDPMTDCWEFDYKRGTFWRWVRGVVGGEAVAGACGDASLRIEYRPLPTQPTVRDVVGVQVLTAGLLGGLVAADHPLSTLPREAAERSFYSAAESGPGADLAWVTAEGERTDDADGILAEVFEFARRGLDEQGVPRSVQDRYLDPLAARWEAGTTPSRWKKARVRAHLADGDDLVGALTGMQREYLERSREYETFAAWPEVRR